LRDKEVYTVAWRLGSAALFSFPMLPRLLLRQFNPRFSTSASGTTCTPSSSVNASGVRAFHRQASEGQRKNPPSWWQKPRFPFTVKMSSVAGGATAMGSAGLYAVVSNPAQIGARPEEAAEKAHHLKNGKGFRNPWDSYREMSGPSMMFSMIW
jgi:hypothetical protein